MNLPVVGAPGHAGSKPAGSSAEGALPESLLARHGGAAREVVDVATVAEPLRPIADGIEVTRAEIQYALSHEGALDVADVLDRRTRIGLVAADAERARGAIAEIVAEAAVS